MNVQPTRLSPLHATHVQAGATLSLIENWQVVTAIGTVEDEIAAAQESIGIADLSDRTKIFVDGDDAGSMLKQLLGGPELAVNQATYLETAGLYVVSLRRDRFYLSGSAGRESDLLEQLNSAAIESPGLVTVTNETDARSELLLIGPHATTCLSRVCGLDFYDDEFPVLAGKQTSVAKIRQLILRCDRAELPAYIISGGRSNAIYLWETLLQAGGDLNMQVIGREATDFLWN
ncbi:hypothetical protein KFU94_62650 [Chloroflexi bacterium TSY]|nr:hypothetical protein [Chloroflexi bacterium TSY]